MSHRSEHLPVRILGTLALLFLSVTASVQASTIFLGSNATGPIQLFTTDGTFISDFGPIGASSAALDSQGNVYVSQPGDFHTDIRVYAQNQSQLRRFRFTGGTDNGNGYPGYISDMTSGAGGTFWVSGYNGMVYNISSAGAILSSFDTGSLYTGITTDGTHLYTSDGLAGGNLHQRAFDGTILATIATGLPETFGLGFDAADGTLWIGGSDTLANIGLDGSLIKAFSLPGFHNGVEVGDWAAAPIPEPTTLLITGAGLAGLLILKRRRFRVRNFLPLVAAVAVCASWSPRLDAALTVTQAAAPAQPQPVGTKVTWTATATDTAAGAIDYRFSVRAAGGTFMIVKDFSPSRVLDWTPSAHEGVYEVKVTARNKSTAATLDRIDMYLVSSRVVGNAPVVSQTAHPLVALYSAPACPAGSQMRVRFQRAVGDPFGQKTPLKPCTPATSMNFYVAGMLANTQYLIKHDLFSGPAVKTSPALSFTSGSLPAGMPIATVRNPADPPSSLEQGVLLNSNFSQAGLVFQTATDLSGNVIWYNPVKGPGIRRPLPGGTMLLHAQDNFLQEIDLVGSVIRETNTARISEQLVAMGKQAITGIHHESFQLPNGNIASLVYLERIINDVQGPGPVNILSDGIVVLDRNLQVVWSWNGFDHMDVTRKALLDEKCVSGQGGCPPVITLGPVANDWLHSNSISLTTDGHFIVSVRHQDWVIKINYANGTGAGNVIWRLGKGGDFTINSPDPYPWFSHQHDAEYEMGGNLIMSLYDNTNLRRIQFPTANSRGQVYRIDEVTRTASHVLNADLGAYAFAVGAAQRLLNGNYHFTNGILGATAQSVEVQPNGQINFNLESSNPIYRSFRMRDMYNPY